MISQTSISEVTCSSGIKFVTVIVVLDISPGLSGTSTDIERKNFESTSITYFFNDYVSTFNYFCFRTKYNVPLVEIRMVTRTPTGTLKETVVVRNSSTPLPTGPSLGVGG